MKTRVGHKDNSVLNGEWATHVRNYAKKLTASARRTRDKKIIKKDLKEIEDNII